MDASDADFFTIKPAVKINEGTMSASEKSQIAS
jgi:hypothetical protein